MPRSSVKASSTNQFNKKQALDRCPITVALEKIGGRWKPIILYYLTKGPHRYTELRKTVALASEKMLIQHLKELESDGLIIKTVHQEMPPHVEYSLSDAGQRITSVLLSMADWSIENGWKQ